MIETDNQLLQIDKISDDVLTITSNIVLRFNVSLSKIVSNKRQHFHKEFSYSSKTSNEPLVTIRRCFDYYLTFENVKNSYDKLFVRIGIGEILLLRAGFDAVASWFTDKKYATLFVKKNGKLTITAPIPDYVVHGLPQGKYIKFTPAVIEFGESNLDKVAGVTMDFGDGINIVNLTLEKFMGLKYVVSCFNMYQSAITLINYISRPSVGTNSMNFCNTNGRTLPPENIECGATGIDGRKVQPKCSLQQIDSLEG